MIARKGLKAALRRVALGLALAAGAAALSRHYQSAGQVTSENSGRFILDGSRIVDTTSGLHAPFSDARHAAAALGDIHEGRQRYQGFLWSEEDGTIVQNR